MHTYELPNWGLRNGYTSLVTAPRVKEKINASVLLIIPSSSSTLPVSTRLLNTEKHNKVKSWLLLSNGNMFLHKFQCPWLQFLVRYPLWILSQYQIMYWDYTEKLQNLQQSKGRAVVKSMSCTVYIFKLFLCCVLL